MTTEAMSSLGYGICAVTLVAALSIGIAALKSLLFKACKKNARSRSCQMQPKTHETSG